MSTALSVKNQSLGAILSAQETIIANALRGRVEFAEFAVSLDAAVAVDDKLRECVEKNPDSVKNAIMHAALLGLRPGPVHKHFALTCFNSKRAKGGVECVGIPQWQGMVHVADQAGCLETSIRPDVVYEYEAKDPDLFSYDPTTELVTHNRPLIEGDDVAKKRIPSKLVAAYATCRVKGRSDWVTVLLRKSDIERLRGFSASFKFQGDRSLWITDPVPMWRKSAVHSLLRSGKVPLSRDILNTVETAAEADVYVPGEEIKQAEVVQEAIPAAAAGDAPAESSEEPRQLNGVPIVEKDGPPADETVIWDRGDGKLREFDGKSWKVCKEIRQGVEHERMG